MGPSAAEHDQDGAVHLGRAGDHVLDVVGVPGAVDVGVVAVLGLVLDVGGVDGDAARLLFGRRVDLVVRLGLAAVTACSAPIVSAAVKVVLPWSTCPMVPTFTCGLVRSNLLFAIRISQDSGLACLQGSLATRLSCLLTQHLVPMARIERATSPLPRECSTTEPHGPSEQRPWSRPVDLQFEKSSATVRSACRTGAGDGNRTRVISLEG